MDYKEINSNKRLEDMEGEIWEDIDEVKGYYMISNLGRVKALERIKDTGRYFPEHIMSGSSNGKNYLSVMFTIDKIHFRRYVHILVAQKFVKLPDDFSVNKYEVNHLDENPLNNQYTNLQWVTHKENMNYGTRKERLSKMFKGKNFSDGRKQEVFQINGKGDIVGYYPSIAEASRRTHVSAACISQCCRGENLSAGGYVWLYGDSYDPWNIDHCLRKTEKIYGKNFLSYKDDYHMAIPHIFKKERSDMPCVVFG